MIIFLNLQMGGGFILSSFFVQNKEECRKIETIVME